MNAPNEPDESLEIEVAGYSGYKANERPLHFNAAGERVAVSAVLDRWYGPESDWFKVCAEDGRVFLLRWHRLQDRWWLVQPQGGVRRKASEARVAYKMSSGQIEIEVARRPRGGADLLPSGSIARGQKELSPPVPVI